LRRLVRRKVPPFEELGFRPEDLLGEGKEAGRGYGGTVEAACPPEGHTIFGSA
jgi:hypothetical protein